MRFGNETSNFISKIGGNWGVNIVPATIRTVQRHNPIVITDLPMDFLSLDEFVLRFQNHLKIIIILGCLDIFIAYKARGFIIVFNFDIFVLLRWSTLKLGLSKNFLI